MIIYHHAKEISPDGNIASVLRPARMREAFEAIGEDVFDLTGCGSERVRKARQLVRRLDSSDETAVLYSESVNVPPALTWLRKGLHRMSFDYQLIKRIHDRGIATGLFYRDIHWRFERAKVRGFRPYIKNRVIPFFGRQELRAYQRSVDVLFLPDVRMKDYLPYPFAHSEIRSLPPGGERRDLGHGVSSDEKMLNLLYVGNIAPPVYDLREFFTAAEKDERLRLKVVTRERALNLYGHLYNFEGYQRLTVLHAQGKELDAHYAGADAALCVWNDCDYHEFVMPVKVFEAISYGVPLIVSAGSKSLADFVKREQLGWVVSGPAEFTKLLKYLAENPEELQRTRERVLHVRERHTWEERAREVVDVLRQAGSRRSS